MRHTKGPWIADGNGFAPTFDVSSDSGSICTVTTNRADADLIASAPEMLEALETAFNFLLKNGKTPTEKQLCNFIGNVIKKAWGE